MTHGQGLALPVRTLVKPRSLLKVLCGYPWGGSSKHLCSPGVPSPSQAPLALPLVCQIVTCSPGYPCHLTCLQPCMEICQIVTCSPGCSCHLTCLQPCMFQLQGKKHAGRSAHKGKNTQDVGRMSAEQMQRKNTKNIACLSAKQCFTPGSNQRPLVNSIRGTRIQDQRSTTELEKRGNFANVRIFQYYCLVSSDAPLTEL